MAIKGGITLIQKLQKLFGARAVSDMMGRTTNVQTLAQGTNNPFRNTFSRKYLAKNEDGVEEASRVILENMQYAFGNKNIQQMKNFEYNVDTLYNMKFPATKKQADIIDIKTKSKVDESGIMQLKDDLGLPEGVSPDSPMGKSIAKTKREDGMIKDVVESMFGPLGKKTKMSEQGAKAYSANIESYRRPIVREMLLKDTRIKLSDDVRKSLENKDDLQRGANPEMDPLRLLNEYYDVDFNKLDQLEEIRFTARNETEAADEFLQKGGLEPKKTTLEEKFKDTQKTLKEQMDRLNEGDFDPDSMAQGGRAGFSGGGIIKLLNFLQGKLGKKAITTANKLSRPETALNREMFGEFNERMNRQILEVPPMPGGFKLSKEKLLKNYPEIDESFADEIMAMDKELQGRIIKMIEDRRKDPKAYDKLLKEKGDTLDFQGEFDRSVQRSKNADGGIAGQLHMNQGGRVGFQTGGMNYDDYDLTNLRDPFAPLENNNLQSYYLRDLDYDSPFSTAESILRINRDIQPYQVERDRIGQILNSGGFDTFDPYSKDFDLKRDYFDKMGRVGYMNPNAINISYNPKTGELARYLKNLPSLDPNKAPGGYQYFSGKRADVYDLDSFNPAIRQGYSSVQNLPKNFKTLGLTTTAPTTTAPTTPVTRDTGLASTIFPEGEFQDIRATSKTPTEYNIRATKDLVENLPGGIVRDVLAPAAAGVMSLPYDAIQAAQRMKSGSGVSGFIDAYKAERPLSTAMERMTGAAAPLAERMQAASAKGLDARMGRTYAENKQLMADPRMLQASGGRVGLEKGGPPNPGRRNFMKLMAGLASIPIVGKLFKGAKVASKIVPLQNTTTTMPAWFPNFVDKFIAKGVGKKIDEDIMEYTTKDLPGIKMTKHDDGRVFVEGQNDYYKSYEIEYEPPGYEVVDYKTGKAVKTKGDFMAHEEVPVNVDPDGNADFDAEVLESVDNILSSDARTMEEFATGKKIKEMKRGEFEVGRAESLADAARKGEDFATGGLAGQLNL